MKKYLILLLAGLVIFTGCGKDNKKDEPKKEEKKEVVIETSPNVNFDLIDTKYKISQDFIKQIDALIENAVYDKAKKFEPEKDILE